MTSKLPIRLACALALVSTLPTSAWGKPRVEVSVSQVREVVESREGTSQTRLVQAQTASPGDVIRYTVTFVNRGDEPALAAVIDDRVPAGTTFLSAEPVAGIAAAFSVDGGRSFGSPERLTREVRLPSGQVESRPIPPAEYTHVRWTLARLEPGASGSVSFRVRVN
jgi:uncharacterized repeat protein (TIGR01451 family)